MPCNHFFTTKEFILKTKEEILIEKARKNRELIKNGFNLKELITPEQRHTNNIKTVKDKESYEETAALNLTVKDKGIFLNFADCTPVILYDPIQKTGAVIHSGWRGTVQKIVYLTAEKMISKFNSKAENIIGVIGPCICFECFETNEETANKLNLSVFNNKGIIKEKENKFYADLKDINTRPLIEAGIKNIDVAPYCTYHNNDKFFSYRKENKTTNRMSAFLTLN